MELPTREAYLAQLEPETCPICYDFISSPTKTTCGHLFCNECLKTWLKSSHTCPTCRSELFEPRRQVRCRMRFLPMPEGESLAAAIAELQDEARARRDTQLRTDDEILRVIDWSTPPDNINRTTTQQVRPRSRLILSSDELLSTASVEQSAGRRAQRDAQVPVERDIIAGFQRPSVAQQEMVDDSSFYSTTGGGELEARRDTRVPTENEILRGTLGWSTYPTSPRERSNELHTFAPMPLAEATGRRRSLGSPGRNTRDAQVPSRPRLSRPLPLGTTCEEVTTIRVKLQRVALPRAFGVDCTQI